MKHSVLEMTRAVRRRLERVVRNSREKDHARRALAVLHLWEMQGNVAEVAHRVRAARSSVYRWLSLYETYGEDGLRPQARGRSEWKANDEVLSMLDCIVREDPRELGYLRSRWSSQLLAIELESRSGVQVHATTVRRWLARLRFRYRRARPTTFRRDPRKAERLAAIEAALVENDPYTEVFYADEADVDLNPRIGSSWMRCGEQTTVPTPGKNQKHYLAGALHARTGRLVWTEHHRKTSVLFVKLLEQLRRQYRRARSGRGTSRDCWGRSAGRHRRKRSDSPRGAQPPLVRGCTSRRQTESVRWTLPYGALRPAGHVGRSGGTRRDPGHQTGDGHTGRAGKRAVAESAARRDRLTLSCITRNQRARRLDPSRSRCRRQERSRLNAPSGRAPGPRSSAAACARATRRASGSRRTRAVRA